MSVKTENKGKEHLYNITEKNLNFSSQMEQECVLFSPAILVWITKESQLGRPVEICLIVPVLNGLMMCVSVKSGDTFRAVFSVVRGLIAVSWFVLRSLRNMLQ